MADKTENESLDLLLPEHINMLLTDPSLLEDFGLSLRISGGLPHQSFRLNLTISENRMIYGDLSDTLFKRKIILEQKYLKREQFLDLLRFIMETGILTKKPQLPQFVPDTLIGSIHIQYKKFVYQALFHADEKQAKSATKMASDTAMKLVKYVYALAKDVYGVVIDPNESEAG